MLVRVDLKSGDVRLLSVPRDLLVEVAPGPGEQNRINAANNFGGIDQTVTAFEDYSGVDHYAVVNFEGFRDVINALGEIEVDGADEVPPKHKIEDGLQTLNGQQALFFVRYRGISGGDIDRIARQQLVAVLRSQAFGLNTVRQLPTIVRVANRNVQTDLELGQGVTLGRVLLKRGPNSQMTAQQLKGDPETLENGDQVLVPDAEANDEILERVPLLARGLRPRAARCSLRLPLSARRFAPLGTLPSEAFGFLVVGDASGSYNLRYRRRYRIRVHIAGLRGPRKVPFTESGRQAAYRKRP